MDLKNILSLFKQKFIIIVLVVSLFVAASAVITITCITPSYSAKATMIVNKSNMVNNSSDYVYSEYTYNDILLIQRLVDTYSIIITSDSVLNKVAENLDLNMTADQLREHLTVSGVGDTEIIQITVTDTIPKRASDIANEITRVCPDEIIRMVKAGSVELIDYAVLPQKPSSPNIVNNILIAGVLGFVLICFIIIALEYLNKTIKSPKDVEDLIGLPILGQLPKYTK